MHCIAGATYALLRSAVHSDTGRQECSVDDFEKNVWMVTVQDTSFAVGAGLRTCWAMTAAGPW